MFGQNFSLEHSKNSSREYEETTVLTLYQRHLMLACYLASTGPSCLVILFLYCKEFESKVSCFVFPQSILVWSKKMLNSTQCENIVAPHIICHLSILCRFMLQSAPAISSRDAVNRLCTMFPIFKRTSIGLGGCVQSLTAVQSATRTT